MSGTLATMSTAVGARPGSPHWTVQRGDAYDRAPAPRDRRCRRATAGRHHEIYLSDPRRTAPDRLRTILRQPIDGQPLTAK
jgi:hypothetical protein